MQEHIFIVRCGEVALKGMNKPYFERMLAERIRKLLKRFDGVSVYRHEGLIFVRADAALDQQEIIKQISKVFGVASISPAVECESTMEAIGEAAVGYMLRGIEERGIKTFKVEAKRADKNFPVKSPEIGRKIGAAISSKTMPSVYGRSFFVSGVSRRLRLVLFLTRPISAIPAPAPRYRNPAIIVGGTFCSSSLETGAFSAYSAAARTAQATLLCIPAAFRRPSVPLTALFLLRFSMLPSLTRPRTQYIISALPNTVFA